MIKGLSVRKERARVKIREGMPKVVRKVPPRM